MYEVNKSKKDLALEQLKITMDESNLFDCPKSLAERKRRTMEPIHTHQFNFNNVLKRFQHRNRRDSLQPQRARVIVDCGANQIKQKAIRIIKQEPVLNCIDSIRTKSMTLTQRPTIS